MAVTPYLVLGRVRPPPPHPLLLRPLPLFLLTGVRLACLGRSRWLLKRIATAPARSLITRASMKVLYTTVNLSPTFPFTLMPPMPLLNLSTPPPSPRPTATAPHHPSIPTASELPHHPSMSSLFSRIPQPTPPHLSLARLTVSSLPTLGQRTTCSRTKMGSSHTGQSPVFRYARATTHSPPSLALALLSLPSMANTS